MNLKTRPSLREKKRYVVFRIHSDGALDFSNVRNAITDSLEKWLGEKDLARANVWIIKNLWNARQKTGFIRCSVKFVDSVKMGLALIHQIGDSRVVFHVTKVTGTIKSGKK